MKSLFPEHIDLTARVMDFQVQRQNIVSGNLANINTPGYKARTLEFEKDLQDALGLSQQGAVRKTHPAHLPGKFSPDSTEASIVRDLNPRIVQGTDNVNLDKETSAMAKNTLMYSALSTVMQRDFTGLKQIIQEGNK